MSFHYHKIWSIFLLIFFCISPLKKLEGDIKRTNLYILEFDNLRSDPSVEWLSTGLVEMLRKEFLDVDGVQIYGRHDFEGLLQDRSKLLRQAPGTRNILLMGTYVRDLDQVTINIQYINIANWEELGRETILGSINQVSKLRQNLFSKVIEGLKGQIPPPIKRGELATPRVQAKVPEYRYQAKELNIAMSDALEGLEESMDYYIGARGELDESGKSGGKFYRDFSFGESGMVEDKPSEDAILLESIVSKISKNPYTVAIEKPILEIDKEKKEIINVILPIRYSLRENVIRDMLSSLPYTALKQDGHLTTLEFSRKKFFIPLELEERISQGDFRVVPVIQVLDNEGKVKVVILDSPDPEWYKRSSDQVHFYTHHIFSPLIVFSIGGWSLQVTMESVDINAQYQMKLPQKEVRNFSRITVEFVPETDLEDFLGKIL